MVNLVVTCRNYLFWWQWLHKDAIYSKIIYKKKAFQISVVGHPCTVRDLPVQWCPMSRGQVLGLGVPYREVPSSGVMPGPGDPCTEMSNASWVMVTWDLPPVGRHTHTSKNITFLQLRWWMVKTLIERFPSYYRPKRSFGQGNIFTSVCLSTGGGVSGLVPGGLQFFGGSPIFFRGGWSSPGGEVSNFFWGGGFSGIRSTFGRYASYWNAFLCAYRFHSNLLILCLRCLEIYEPLTSNKNML